MNSIFPSFVIVEFTYIIVDKVQWYSNYLPVSVNQFTVSCKCFCTFFSFCFSSCLILNIHFLLFQQLLTNTWKQVSLSGLTGKGSSACAQ